MAASRGSAAGLAALVAILAVLLLTAPAAAEVVAARYPPLAPGLSFDFYKKSCPKAEFIVNDFLKSAIRQNVGLAAALIRLHFHDCFVQGCDGSILLDTTPTEKSEQEAGPNLTLRPAAFKAINDIRDRLEKACGRVVSCADIVGLAARDSVRLALHYGMEGVLMTHKYRGSIVVLSISKSVEPNEEQKKMISGFQ